MDRNWVPLSDQLRKCVCSIFGSILITVDSSFLFVVAVQLTEYLRVSFFFVSMFILHTTKISPICSERMDFSPLDHYSPVFKSYVDEVVDGMFTDGCINI